MDDGKEFMSLCSALADVGISPEQQEALFALISGLLWLGNITVQAVTDDSSKIKADAALDAAASMLGVQKDALAHALTHKKVGADAAAGAAARCMGKMLLRQPLMLVGEWTVSTCSLVQQQMEVSNAGTQGASIWCVGGIIHHITGVDSVYVSLAIDYSRCTFMLDVSDAMLCLQCPCSNPTFTSASAPPPPPDPHP